MAMSRTEALELVADATRIANELAILVPQLEQNVAAVKAALAETDDQALSAQIEQLHAQSADLTRQIAALRD